MQIPNSHKKSKVVVIGPCYPFRGGIATFVAHFCDSISQNYDTTLINYTTLYPSILFPGKTQYDLSENKKITFPNIRMLSSVNPLTWIKVAKKIASIQPDLIVIDWWQPFFGPCIRGIYTLLPKELKNRVFIVAENVVSHESRWIDKFLTRLGFGVGKQYLALSDEVVKQINYFYTDKPIHKSNLPIYDTFSTSSFDQHAELREKLGFSPTDKIILFFGYVRKYKGLDILIEAFAILKKKRKDIKLLIVGEFYDDPKQYTDIIDANQLNQDVKMIDFYVPNEDIEQYFRISNVVALSYRNGTQSGILNIALGFKKPVVSTNVGGLHEFIIDDKTGVICQNVNPNDFANALDHFFDLEKDVDFEKNIDEVIQNNSFGKINNIISEAIAYSQTLK